MSQSCTSFLDEVSSWTSDICSLNAGDAVPKLITYFEDASSKVKETVLIKLLCSQFVPAVEEAQLESLIFSQIHEKANTTYNNLLEEITTCATDQQQNLEDKAQKINSLLEDCFQLIQSFEECVLYLLTLEGAISTEDIHSLPDILIHLIKTSYLHCKESSQIYGEALTVSSSQLSALFKKAHSLQMSFINLIDKISFGPDATEDLIQDMTAMITGLHEIGQIAAGLDLKIMITIWKTVSRLSCQYKEQLCHYLDVDNLLHSLAEDITSTFIYTIQLAPAEDAKGLSNEAKAYMRAVKVLGFQMKVLISMVKEYQEFLHLCTKTIYTMMLTLKRHMPPSLDVRTVPQIYIDEAQKQIVAGIEPLLLHLLENRHFIEYVTLTKQDSEASLHGLPRILLLVAILDTVQNTSVENQNLWLSPVLNPEDEDRESLIAAVFSCIPKCGVELSFPVKVPGVMCNGKPQIDIPLYEHICIHLSAAIASSSVENFSCMEEILLTNVFSDNVYNALMAIDVWCFLARYGTSDLCFDHCVFLSKLLVCTQPNPSMQYCHLVILIRRILKFLAKEHQVDFLKGISEDDKVQVYSVIPWESFSDSLVQQAVDNIVPVCSKTIHNWNTATNRTLSDVARVTYSLNCLQNLGGSSNALERFLSKPLQHLICEKCIALWTSIPQDSTVLGPCYTSLLANLLPFFAKMINCVEDKEILVILNTLPGLLQSRQYCGIYTSTFELLQAVGKKSLTPSHEQTQILQKIPEIFGLLLGHQNSVVQQFAIETFTQFAEETLHESIVSDSLQTNNSIQEKVVTYLNKIANQDITTCPLDVLQKQDEVLTLKDNLSAATLYPVAEWKQNDIQQEPPEKKLKTDFQTEDDKRCRDAVNRVKEELQRFRDLKTTYRYLPLWLITELQNIKSSLTDLL